MNVSEQIILLMNYLMSSIEITTVHRWKIYTSFLTEKWFTEEKEYVKFEKNKPTKYEQASIDYIVKHYAIKELDLLWDSRERDLQLARKHLCFLLKQKWRTLQRIWALLNKSHSAIIYLLKQYDNYKNSEKVSWNEDK